MTEPSQYFKGRTVQEQMNEVIGYVDVRSAEVATDAIAADVAQVHQDMLDADADASAAAASAAAAAGTLANAVKKTGEASQSIAGDIAVSGDLSGGTVTVPTPVNNTDAASKKYVDDADALDAKLAGATFTGQLNASGQRAYSPRNTTDVATIGTLDAYTPMVRTTGNQTVAGAKQFNGNIAKGCTANNMLTTPSAEFGATIMSFVDKMNDSTHNSLGSITKVKNSSAQDYIDILNTSYGYNDGVDQWRIDAFIRILISDTSGNAQVVFYRQKRKADGTGTVSSTSKVLESILFSE